MTRPEIILAGANTRTMLSAMPDGQCQLESYIDFSHRNPVNENRHLPWVLDCGAFTAYRQNKTIDLMEYAEHTKSHNYRWCLSVDVIDGGPHDNEMNFNRLIAMGLETVPVWHEGEPLSLLRDYCTAVRRYSHPLVAIGTQWPRAVDRIKRMLDKAFCILSVPCHGLALVSYGGMYPFESVDSRTWASACAGLKSSPWKALPLRDKIEMYLKSIHATWKQQGGDVPAATQGSLL